jgi:hypothetical protein
VVAETLEVEMTDGKFLYVPTPAHRCVQPEITTFGPNPPGSDVPAVSTLAAGTVWECGDCGTVWKVRYCHPRQLGLVGGNSWFRERRRERRERLGLSWWQRERQP